MFSQSHRFNLTYYLKSSVLLIKLKCVLHVTWTNWGPQTCLHTMPCMEYCHVWVGAPNVAWMLSKLQNRHSTIDPSCAIDLFFYSMFFLNLWSKLPYWTITWVLKAWLCYNSLNFKEFYSLQLNEEAQAKNMLKLFYVRALFCNNHTEAGSDNLCETMNVGRW